ncbi:MAG TPA: hypothetical protein VIQ54_20545 [Polyangia bacterium]|jgi:hypothetical protein
MTSASILLAISGMLAAEPAGTVAAGRAPVAVEISFATIAGEGAAGRKCFMRDGCYQVESGGGTGGAGYARDSQAGCLLPADVAAVFARLGAIADSALVREKAAGPKGGAAGGARARGLLPGDDQTQVVLIRDDGSRWVAANKPAADDILRAVNELPSENQWYAKPPEKPVGKGGQLVVVSAAATASARGGSRRLQAVLASDGRWWCYRSVIGEQRGERELPAGKVSPLPAAAASERLGRILAGADTDAGPDKPKDGPEISVEAAWPGKPRAALKPSVHEKVVKRFVAEMKPVSPTCSYAPESEPRR